METYTTANEAYDGIAPAISTNTAENKRLVLNANFRPTISAENPHTIAPTRRPSCEASEIHATCLFGEPYSLITAGLAMDWQTTRSFDGVS